MRTKMYLDDDLSTVVTFDGAITSATVYDNDGVYARGNAKHNPADDYSATFGELLAVTRARGRYARKVERNLIRSTR